MASFPKRRADDYDDGGSKRTKTKKQWQTPRQGGKGGANHMRHIEPGDCGIWVTCNKGREGKCTGEIRDLFSEYAEQLYPATSTATSGEDQAAESMDIESEINAEVSHIRTGSSALLFASARVDVQCVIFIKTSAPVEPVSFVKKICEDALANPNLKRTRFAKRLSPMTLMGQATTEGLDKIAREVLKPHFHQEPFQKRKFAIRPTLRNHHALSRDSIIKQVASIVGPGHEVDLKNYDLLIIVEVYQNICGVSVVDADFERLKRFNIAEIFDPTPMPKEIAPEDDKAEPEA